MHCGTFYPDIADAPDFPSPVGACRYAISSPLADLQLAAMRGNGISVRTARALYGSRNTTGCGTPSTMRVPIYGCVRHGPRSKSGKTRMTLTTTMFRRSESEMLASPFSAMEWSAPACLGMVRGWLNGLVEGVGLLFDCCGLRRESECAVFPEPADDVHFAGMAVKAQDQPFFAV